MKKIILMLVALFVLLGLTVYALDYIVFHDIEDLASFNGTTDVVRVEALEEQWVDSLDIASGGGMYFINTITEVWVLEVFQGNLTPGDIIPVRQLGGQLGDEHSIWDGVVHFTQGDDLILFLGGGRTLPKTPVQHAQSVYRVAPAFSNESIANMDAHEVLMCINVNHRYNLTLTAGDLLAIAESNFGYVRSAWADGEWQLDEPTMSEIDYPEYPNGEAHPPEPETEEPPPPDTETGSLAQRLTLPLAIGGGAGGGLLLVLFWLKRRKKDDETAE